MRKELSGSQCGFEYVIIVMDLGYRCGYVKIPKNHPWYGVHYNEIDIEVHGGLTFSSLVGLDHPILSNGYWIGFDCMHSADLPDRDEAKKEYIKYANMFSKLKLDGSKIRNLRYVESKCRNICVECSQILKIKESFDLTAMKDINKKSSDL
jgi:hypothetical protein